MKSDYYPESSRKAYASGVTARIKGMSENDNPYLLIYNKKLWLAGFNEKGSIKDKTK